MPVLYKFKRTNAKDLLQEGAWHVEYFYNARQGERTFSFTDLCTRRASKGAWQRRASKGAWQRRASKGAWQQERTLRFNFDPHELREGR